MNLQQVELAYALSAKLSDLKSVIAHAKTNHSIAKRQGFFVSQGSDMGDGFHVEIEITPFVAYVEDRIDRVRNALKELGVEA